MSAAMPAPNTKKNIAPVPTACCATVKIAAGNPKPMPNHVAVAAPRARRKLDASRLPQPDAILFFTSLSIWSLSVRDKRVSYIIHRYAKRDSICAKRAIPQIRQGT